MTLDKVRPPARGPDAWAKASIVGGEGADCAPALNPLSEGDSLTGLGARGARTLARCRGASVCVSREFRDASSAPPSARSAASRDAPGAREASFRRFRRLAAAHRYPPRAIAQVTVRPGTRAAASLSASLDGGFGGGAHGMRMASDELGRGGSAALGLGAQALFAVGERALVAGWASSDGGDWGVAATAPPRGASPGWGVVVGRDADAGTAGEGAGAERSGRAHARGRSGARRLRGSGNARGGQTRGPSPRASSRRETRGRGGGTPPSRSRRGGRSARGERGEETRSRRGGRGGGAHIPDNTRLDYFRKYHTKVYLLDYVLVTLDS